VEYSQEDVIQRINSTRDGTVWEVLDITLVAAEKDRVVATMPIGPQHRQQLGYLHGGVSVVLAESLASLGGALNVGSDKQMVFGLEINANHLRPKREGTLTGVAIPLHRGRSTHVWEVKISDEQDRLVCISRCTIAVVDRPPDVSDPLATRTSSLD
jgi:1,4-dihydroxy-2-naphthoyl-CoA hydrolase